MGSRYSSILDDPLETKLLSSPESAEVERPDFIEAVLDEERELLELLFWAAAFFRASIFSAVDSVEAAAVVVAAVVVSVGVILLERMAAVVGLSVSEFNCGEKRK